MSNWFGGVFWGRDPTYFPTWLPNCPNGMIPLSFLLEMSLMHLHIKKLFLKMPSIKNFRSLEICTAPQRHVSISVSSLHISPSPISSIHKCLQRVLYSEPCMFLWGQRIWAWRRGWVHSDRVTMLSNPSIKSGWDFLRQGLCFFLLVSGYTRQCWWIETWVPGSSSVEIYP